MLLVKRMERLQRLLTVFNEWNMSANNASNSGYNAGIRVLSFLRPKH